MFLVLTRYKTMLTIMCLWSSSSELRGCLPGDSPQFGSNKALFHPLIDYLFIISSTIQTSQQTPKVWGGGWPLPCGSHFFVHDARQLIPPDPLVSDSPLISLWEPCAQRGSFAHASHPVLFPFLIPVLTCVCLFRDFMLLCGKDRSSFLHVF